MLLVMLAAMKRQRLAEMRPARMRPIEENGDWADRHQYQRQRKLEHADPDEGGDDDPDIRELPELPPPELERYGEQQADGSSRDTFEQARDLGILPIRFPQDAERHYHDGAGQQHPEDGEGRARNAAQIVADDHRHVNGVKPRQRLADFHRVEELLVGHPLFAPHQVFAKIGDRAAAEA
jgi:hypothetical protein